MRRLATVSAFCLLTAGCRVLHVKDAFGEPVSGVLVKSICNHTSFSDDIGYTDHKGRTLILPTSDLSDPDAIVLEKPGYEERWIPFPRAWPATVTLKRMTPEEPKKRGGLLDLMGDVD